MIGDTIKEQTADDILVAKLQEWLTNPPDYYDVSGVYDTLADLRKEARLLRRAINEVETDIEIEVDKPRSNEVKKQKAKATRDLANQLATVEADIEYYEMKAKKLEYIRGMANTASYILKSRNELL